MAFLRHTFTATDTIIRQKTKVKFTVKCTLHPRFLHYTWKTVSQYVPSTIAPTFPKFVNISGLVKVNKKVNVFLGMFKRSLGIELWGRGKTTRHF